MATIHYGAIMWTQAWVHMQTLLRANLLAAQVASGGPEAGQPVGSSGEAVTHFRDDTEDVTMFVDGMIDVSAGLVFTVLAGAVLGSTNAGAAAVLLLPLAGVALATRALDGRIKQYRVADRAASMAVSGLLGDVMAAATTVKVNAAIEPTMSRLAGAGRPAPAHCGARPRAGRRRAGVQPGRGRHRAGSGADRQLPAAWRRAASTSGELAVFTAYLGWLSFLPRMVGRVHGPAQAGGCRLRPDACAGGRPRRDQHRHRARSADRSA